MQSNQQLPASVLTESSQNDHKLASRRKRRTAAMLAGVVVGMVGLSFAAVPLYRDMEDSVIADAIARNRALANDLRITGTPTFVVGDEIIRGLVDLATLKRFIADVREKPEG